MTETTQPPVLASNHLLSQLPVHERNALHRIAVGQVCEAGEVLISAQTHSRFVYFPMEAVVSVVRPLRDHQPVEIGMIGNEGMIGLDVIMEARTQTDDAIVQCGGTALRIPSDDLIRQFHSAAGLQRHLLQFAHAFLDQVAQNAVCNRFHPLRARLSRRLLMISDRVAADDVRTTPALIAAALGADLGEIEAALTRLGADKAVRLRRNSIEIDRDRLEPNACECYSGAARHSG